MSQEFESNLVFSAQKDFQGSPPPDKLLKFSPRRLLESGVETERIEQIPRRLIVLEASITDQEHIDRLARSMSGKRGQISPITVRARDAGKEIHYDIVDGFHRAYAAKEIGMETMAAVVIYGCNDEELFDLRVLAANSVRSLQFSRIAQWMRQSFTETKWAERGLSISQVFGLAVFDTSGEKLGLTMNESEEAKKWAAEKSQIWDKSLTSIWDMMRTVEAAAPDLVARVRVGSGGKKHKAGELNPGQLKAITELIPGEYELQRQIASVVMVYSLPVNKAWLLTERASKVKDEPEKLRQLLKDFPLEESDFGRSRGGIYINNRERKYDKGAGPDRKVDRWWIGLRLSRVQKTALELVFLERLDLNQAAQRLGVSESVFFETLRTAVEKSVSSRKSN